jgi:hypothetical protein
MDFKIKIDLSNQQIIDDPPMIEKKKKKKSEKIDKNSKKMPQEKEEKKEIKEISKDLKSGDGKNPIKVEISKKKKNYKRMNRPIREESANLIEKEKPKINSNSIISLTLLNHENTKGDQAQKLGMLSKKKPRHWEKRWVLIPNVFEFTKEIWLKKWVLVDGGEDISDNNVSCILIINIIKNYLQQYYSNYIKPHKEITPKKYVCSFEECGKVFFDSSSFRKHMLTHGERHVKFLFY